ncbi:MAG TPA: pyruvate, phosphate dikinase [Patescibacteria group bacterium]|nr:pyruvate, phosphate dikinase [Patescibacteria group bacterium]
MKCVYFFARGKAEGSAHMRELLGGKGAGLAEMTRIGLPVPAGFTITTETCDYFYKHKQTLPHELGPQVRNAMKNLERATGKRFGDTRDPLLVSVRSGAALSMPGMMETVLNLGLNDDSVEGLSAATGNPRFAWDAYRRFIQMYSSVVDNLPKHDFEERLLAIRKQAGAADDTRIPADGWKKLVGEFKQLYRERTGRDFPQEPETQLWGAIRAVFESWMADKAVTYRRVEKITGLLGTAVSVVQMVFGNWGEDSGTGVCFTRDPSSGDPHFYGDFLPNAQGEDVVAGIRNPLPLTEMAKRLPEAYRQLERARKLLERHYRDMQDVEFTIQQGHIYILQTRTGKRTPAAAFRIAVDLAKEKRITRKEAVMRIKPQDIERLFYPVIDPAVPKEQLEKVRMATGINAVPGAAVGRAVFTAEEAEEWAGRGEKVILVRRETSPEDVGGMYVAQGILTATGGKTSHAAVVARGWGKCCIVGCEALEIDYDTRRMSMNGREVAEGDWITLDGNEGSVYQGQIAVAMPGLSSAYKTLLGWADQIRKLGVRTNADTPHDARKARELGAEGIGLCRTEHMFFKDFEHPERSADRQFAIQEMILASTPEARRRALGELLPFQRRDFIGIFEAMKGLPVTIRLVDPPLHEFVPHDPERQKELAEKIGISAEQVAKRVEQLREANPMLGHRGCRLSITYPEILEMQVRAILEAAVACKKRGIAVFPEIMHPLTMDRKELAILTDATHRVAREVLKEAGTKIKFTVGTMIELPRAALLADQIAQVAEFFSFGTNDLTQTVMGLSRDDAGRFLPEYVDEKKAGIFKEDPFQSLDIEGVGLLIRWAIERGRSTRPNLKIGICGEHGGDPASVKFCHQVGMNYVSASPFRVPIARLAAAHAVVEEEKIKAKGLGRKKRRTRPEAQ